MRSKLGRGHRTVISIALLATFTVAGLPQVREAIWARYESEMQDPVPDPPDADRRGEFVLARLRYRSPLDGGGSYYRWGIDANKADRLFIGILRRLTRIDGQSI